MDASIVILTKNGGENFKKLLPCLLSQRFDGERDILVIDSGSTDGTVDVARGHGVRVEEIRPEEFHHSRTRNLGADHTTGRIIVYITQDALPRDDRWLEELTAPFADPSVAEVAGRQIAWESTKPPEKFFYVYSFPERRIEVKQGVPPYRDSIFISDVNAAYRRDVWEKFRFSERIVQAEDKEIAKRMIAAGWTVLYEPEAAVYHAHDFTLRSLWPRAKEAGVALGQGVGMPRSKHRVLNRVVYYLSESCYIMRGHGWLKWLPYSMVYEASRFIGVVVGWTVKARVGRKTSDPAGSV